MSSEIEFTNFNMVTSKEESIRNKNMFTEKKGWFISYPKAAVLLILFIAVCIIIGVAVYYGHPDKGKNNSQGSSDSQQQDPEQTTSATQSSTYSPEMIDIRLPKDIIPERYLITLRPNIYFDDPEEFKFDGTVAMNFSVHKATDKIVLHHRMLEIDVNSIAIQDVEMSSNAVMVDVENVKMLPSPQEFLEIPTKTILTEGGRYMITMSFSGPIKKDLKGIYYSNYNAVDGSTVYLLTSQLQATDARKVFPCMDEPALKAVFTVVIERKDTKESKSNTRIIETKPLNDGWLADYYEPTPKMSTYLLAFLISDFLCVQENSTSGTLVEICARPTAEDQLEFARSIAVDMQEWFEHYHRIPYPLNKATHVAVPDFSAGAMENWGLIVYRETALLYDPQTSSVANKQRVAVVVSHELAHMWFGNLVTPQWWDDIWLNEGFASYMELMGIHHVKDFHTWKMEEQFVVDDLHEVMIDDSLVTSHPVYLPVNDPLEIGGLFDRITYSKGASVIRMMKYFLREDTFRNGLSKYLKDREYQAADHTDLFNFLSQESQEAGNYINVSSVMNTWILQMGYPIVNFSYKSNEGEIFLSQQHYLLNPNLNVATETSPYNYTWKVPISYMTDQSGPINLNNITLKWLEKREDIINNVPTNCDWIIGNVGETFFYRVNYDMENWRALKNQLLSNHSVIPSIDRAQLIDNVFMMARSGHLPQDLAFELSEYMIAETEYTPWVALNANIRYVRLMLYQTSGNELLRTYIQTLVTSIYNTLGWQEDAENDDHLEQRLRVQILSLACNYGVPDCLNHSKMEFDNWKQKEMNNESYPVSATFASTIFCYGIAESGLDEWDFAHEMLLKSNSGAERTNLLRALACTKHTWILQRYLQWALTEDEYGIRQQDMRTVLVGVASNPLGTHIAWNFFKANWDLFFERFGATSFTLSAMVHGMTEMFSSQWELDDLQQFINKHSNLGTANRAFQQAVESTSANINWREANEKQIISWLPSNDR